MYIVRQPPHSHELSYIQLTDVHEEDGWQVVVPGEPPAVRGNQSQRGNTSLPSPEVIKSSHLNTTTKNEGMKHPALYSSNIHLPRTLINVFYTTGAVTTKLSHPTSTTSTMNYGEEMHMILLLSSLQYLRIQEFILGKDIVMLAKLLGVALSVVKKRSGPTLVIINGGRGRVNRNVPVAFRASVMELIIIKHTQSSSTSRD